MDITMCKGKECPVKNRCYRYNENPELLQTVFVESPSIIDKGVFKCEMFWGKGNQQVLNTLLNILDSK